VDFGEIIRVGGDVDSSSLLFYVPAMPKRSNAKSSAGQRPVESKRDDFDKSVKELLARRAGYRCSICDEPTVAAHTLPDQSIYLGEASHIYSAAPNGPRANPTLTPEQRSAVENGIHLCKKHGKLVDVDVEAYPAETLLKAKFAHEQKIRAIVVGEHNEYDADFLYAHETQIVHGRGAPSLRDLWVPRSVVRLQSGGTPIKRDARALLSSEPGVILISGDQWTGRTSVLKDLAIDIIGLRNCVWLDGRDLTEKILKDPVKFLAAGYRRINPDADGWQKFLEAPPAQNVVFLDDLHLSPLNHATKRKFLLLVRSFAGLVFATSHGAFFVELLGVSVNDGLLFNQWQLADLTRADCADLVKKWCGFGAESIADDNLDARKASTHDDLEMLFGKKLMPRQPLFVLTAIQNFDAGIPVDTSVGSFGGVYDTIIHRALSKNAPNQSAISSERAYMEELAYFCEHSPEHLDRVAFNKWFAERKGVLPQRVDDLEVSLLSKGFLSRSHSGFRFNYQKYYFLASFLRDNPNREGVKEYITLLIKNCWNEDFANTALFLAYLQPSTSLINSLVSEIDGVFSECKEFRINAWEFDFSFPKDFFRGLELTSDPEANRRQLAERLDATDPVDSSEIVTVKRLPKPETEQKQGEQSLDFLKSLHLIKLAGQLIRNSPISFDAEQKMNLVRAGMNLSLRSISGVEHICAPASLKSQALNQVREKVLQKTNRAEIETKLTGMIYNFALCVTYTILKHACSSLAHPDLTLIYEAVLKPDGSEIEGMSHRVLNCGIDFELRAPHVARIEKVFSELTPVGRDLLRVWVWFYLSFNRVAMSRRQAMLEAVDITPTKQLLLLGEAS
jgi:hypothetical protein